MRKWVNKGLAFILSLAMMASICDFTVFAAAYGPDAVTQSRQVSAPGEKVGDIVTPDVSPDVTPGEGGEGSTVTYNYQVTLPEGYDPEDENRKYPVLYLMPDNGISQTAPAMAEQLSASLGGTDITDLIVVEPEFISRTENPAAGVFNAMQAIVEDVDNNYNTIPEASARAIMGTQVGGYLAVVLTYTDGDGSFQGNPNLFGMTACIHGDFVGDANIWKSLYGDFYQIAANSGNGNGNLTNAVARKFYTYMTAASEDEKASVDGGANDIISYYINRGAAYGGGYYPYYGNADSYVLDLTVKNSAYDDAFIKTAATEAVRGFGNKLMQDMVSGSLFLTPQAAYASQESVQAVYEIEVDSLYTAYCGNTEQEMKLTVSMTNPDNGEKVAEDQQVVLNVKETEEGISYTNAENPLILPNTIVNGSTTVTLSGELLGKSLTLDSQPLVRIAATGSAPEEQLIDLLGDWKFYAFKGDGSDEKDSLTVGSLPAKAQYDTWETVQPCLGWWDSDFSSVTDMNSYAGYAWYVKEFDIPADFPEGEYYVPVGYFDETDICFINGVKIGCTGLNESTWKHAEDCWDTERIYSVDSENLNIGGSNVMIVLTHNNSGGGGWYDGHPGLYSAAAYNKLTSKPSTYAPAEEAAIVQETVTKQVKAIKNKDINSYGATVNTEYFQSGKDKAMLLEDVSAYMDGTGKIRIVDENAYVFTADGLYYYQADRMIQTAAGEKLNLDITEYYKIVDGKAYLYGQHDRFYTQTIPSSFKAQAISSTNETEDENFLVYLPEGYFEKENADKRYPVAYVFHQINSSSNSYAIDGIDKLMDQGIAEGTIKDVILVIPDSSKQSWWRNGWDSMVTEEIVPFVDENYRTIADSRYRFTAGASMGGSGSYYIGLTNPDQFSGIISFFGAINMGANPLNIAQSVSSDYLGYFNQYFVCGNRDLYKFGIPAITLDKLLRTNNISHYFELEEGEHDSKFYLPYVIEAFGYQTSVMPVVTDEQAASVVSGTLEESSVSDGKAKITAEVSVQSDITSYLQTIPASSYTETEAPELNIPVTVTISRNGTIICQETQTVTASAAKNETLTFELENNDITSDGGYEIAVAANVLSGTVSLGSGQIAGKPIAQEPADQIYTGTAVTPEITVICDGIQLAEDSDYTVSYKRNTSVGTAEAVVTGKGNYEGYKETVYFEIVERNLNTVTVSAIPKQEYTGDRIRPDVTLSYRGKTIPDSNYTLSYASNEEIGSATVTITGKNNFTGKVYAEFEIVKVPQTINVSRKSYAMTYGDKAVSLEATVSSAIRETGELSYKSSDTKVVSVSSTGTVTIQGAGTATVTVTAAETAHSSKAETAIAFNVARAKQTISVSKTSHSKTYGNAAFTLGATVKATAGTAGKLSYASSNTKVAAVDGNGKVTLKGAGTAVITITAAETAHCSKAATTVTIKVARTTQSISVSKTSHTKTYGNAAFKLGATVKAKAGTAGKLSYKSSNTKVAVVDSRGKVTLKGAGTATITISAAQTTSCNATSKKITITVKPKKASISSISSTRKGKITVSWKKDSKADGYEIIYATNSKFKSKKTINITKSSIVKKTFSASKGKKYYVKIKAYKIGSNGKKIYGSDSSVKQITVKK